MEYTNGRSPFSRFASVEEIKSSLYKVMLNDSNPQFGGVPIYTEKEAVYIEHTDSHTLTDGGTGAKKTRLIAMPSLVNYIKSGESFIASDPKAELYERMQPLLKERGYKIFALNLRDFDKSHCWNPLGFPYSLYRGNNKDKAVELVNDIACGIAKDNRSCDPYWHNSAADLFTGLVLVLFECADKNEINFKSLSALKTQAFDIVKNDAPFIREYFLDHIEPSAYVRSVLSGTVQVTESTRSCIISTLDTALRPFISQEKLLDTLSFNDLDMKNIGNEKTAVFLILPDEHSLYHSLVSVFVKQCYIELITEAQKHPGKKLPRRINYLLDEFASLPAIHDFPAMITASRSRNIRFNLLIQSFNQLNQRYGQEAGTIKGNCEDWIILHSREKETIEELVYLAGNKSGEEPLISASVIQTLNKEEGEALVFVKRKHPFITRLLDIDFYPDARIVDEEAEYPVNNRKAEFVFDFKRFCLNRSGYFLSQLFTGRTHEEILKDRMGRKNYYSPDEDIILEPLFKSRTPVDEDIKNEVGEVNECCDEVAVEGGDRK